MRCKNCDYVLWNLPTRQCPECGVPFRPSEYQFNQSTVQYCCPHCKQSYYGTSMSGHLVPAEFDCVGCQQHIHMDEMILLPTAGLRDEQTERDHMPWLERQRRGRIKSWFRMVGRGLVAPYRLMEATPVESSRGQAWWFAIVTFLITLIASFGPFICLCGAFTLPAFTGGGPGMGGGTAPFWQFLLVILGFGLGSLAILVVGLALWGWVTHGILLMTGGCAHGIGRTYQALGYSSGAFIMSAVPCMGQYIGFPWWIISAVLTTQRGQRVHGGRAALAVLTLPVIVCVCLFVGYVALIIGTQNLAPNAPVTTAWPPNAQITPTTSAWEIASALEEELFIEGDYPDHVLQLVESHYLNAFSFTPGNDGSSVPIADGVLKDWYALPLNQRENSTTVAAENLASGAVAYRFGDFVFTYPGIQANTAPASLWIAILSPNPDRPNNDQSLYDPIEIITADRLVITVPQSSFAAELAAQNELRAEHGLEPIPDPQSITHSKPVWLGK